MKNTLEFFFLKSDPVLVYIKKSKCWAFFELPKVSRPLGIPKEIAQGVKSQTVAFSMSKLPEVSSLGMPKVLLTFGSPKNAQNFDQIKKIQSESPVLKGFFP